MKTPTLKQFIENSTIPAKLIRATVKQCGGWGWEYFTERAADCAKNGANTGVFNGFIYYTDTVAFTKRNKADILTHVEAAAWGDDSMNAITLIASLNSIDLTVVEVAEAIYNPRSENRQEVFNALAWFCAEEVSRAWVDYLENIAE